MGAASMQNLQLFFQVFFNGYRVPECDQFFSRITYQRSELSLKPAFRNALLQQSSLRALSARLEPTIHYRACRQVARHVDGCSAHVQDAIHADDQSNSRRWHADSLQDGRQHDYAYTRRAGRPNRGANRSARKCDQAPDVEVHPEYLSQKNRGGDLVECRPVHVDRRSQWNDETGNGWFNRQFLLRGFHREGHHGRRA